MNFQFPFLAQALGIPEHTHKRNYSPEIRANRQKTRIRELIAGILVISNLGERFPEFKGTIRGELSTDHQDIHKGIDYRLYSNKKKHLMDIDLTLDPIAYVEKCAKKGTDSDKTIILIDSKILIGVMHAAEAHCKSEPGISKEEIMDRIPTFKRSPGDIILDIG